MHSSCVCHGMLATRAGLLGSTRARQPDQSGMDVAARQRRSELAQQVFRVCVAAAVLLAPQVQCGQAGQAGQDRHVSLAARHSAARVSWRSAAQHRPAGLNRHRQRSRSLRSGDCPALPPHLREWL